MTDTPNLALPEIAAAQAQKHVTHNEALRVLDSLVQLAVLDRDLSAPPGSPAEGQRWIVKPAGSGSWAGHANHIAAWQDGAWTFHVPGTGWLAYVADEGALLAWTGTAWVDAIAAMTSLNNMTLLGVGTTADATNPFSAKLNNTLWTAKTVAEGGDGDLRYKLSKESAAKTLSLLFQDNFSGRAEIGLTGDDDFHFKVSADGASWLDALVIDRASGGVSLPNSAWASTGLGFINKFRNAAFDIWQRGTGGTVTAGAPSYTADGWIAGSTGANITWSRQAGRGQSAYSLKLQGATGVTDVFVRQRIESLLCYPLAGRSVTVQASVYNETGAAITPTLTVKRAGSADVWSSPATDINAVALQSCTNTAWTTVSYTFTAHAGAGTGLEVTIGFGNNFGAGTKSVQVCDLDIRAASGVLAPDLRPVFVEAGINQRYLPGWRALNGAFAIGQVLSASSAAVILPYYVPPRVVPTGAIVSAGSDFSALDAGANLRAFTSFALNSATIAGLQMLGTGATNLSAGNACQVYGNSSATIVATGAEL